MLIRRPKGWELPESAVTSEGLYLRRREALKAMGLGALGIAAPGLALADGKYPAPRNDAFGKPAPVTAEKLSTTYNNFYEFSDDKDLWRAAQKMKISPWTIKVSGKVEKEFEIGFDDLLARMPLEERVYRHRCVETWSMTVPWTGFPLKALVAFCKPVGNPQYVVMKTAQDPKTMPGLEEVVSSVAVHPKAWRWTRRPTTWPSSRPACTASRYPKQNGAPLRLVDADGSMALQEREVDRQHRVHRQAAGLVLGEAAGQQRVRRLLGQREPGRAASGALEPGGDREGRSAATTAFRTRLYNGYGEFVAGLYENRKSEKLYI